MGWRRRVRSGRVRDYYPGRAKYHDGLAAAGFTDITITHSHQIAEGMYSAIICATKPTPPPHRAM